MFVCEFIFICVYYICVSLFLEGGKEKKERRRKGKKNDFLWIVKWYIIVYYMCAYIYIYIHVISIMKMKGE